MSDENDKKNEEDEKQFKLKDFLYLLGIAIAITAVVTLVGINNIILVTDTTGGIVKKLYPTNERDSRYNSGWPYTSEMACKSDLFDKSRAMSQQGGAPRSSVSALVSSLNPISLFAGAVFPNYSAWFHDSLRDTFINDRTFIICSSEWFKFGNSNSSKFISGILHFLTLVLITLPVTQFISFYTSVVTGWYPMLLLGFIIAIPISIYTSFYMYLSYLYNSVFGIVMETNVPNLFSKVFLEISWISLLIFLGVFALGSGNCFNDFMSTIIIWSYTALALFTLITRYLYSKKISAPSIKDNINNNNVKRG